MSDNEEKGARGGKVSESNCTWMTKGQYFIGIEDQTWEDQASNCDWRSFIEETKDIFVGLKSKDKLHSYY